MYKIYILILVLFLVIDLPMILWLNKDMYLNMFNKINGNTSSNNTNKIIGAIIAYLLLAFAIYYFVVMPSLEKASPDNNVMLKGCFMGLVIYGIYDGTNLATINNFTMNEAIIDIMWGTFLSGIISVLAVKNSNLL